MNSDDLMHPLSKRFAKAYPGEKIPYLWDLGIQADTRIEQLEKEIEALKKRDNCYKCGKPYQMTPICCECGTLPIVGNDLKELSRLREMLLTGKLMIVQ